MKDEGLDVAGAQPTRQPTTVATSFISDGDPPNRATSLDRLVAPAMQQSEQGVWVGIQFLQRMPF
jgi:hypothetical protein